LPDLRSTLDIRVVHGRLFTAARRELRRVASDSARVELLDVPWAERGAPDKRLRATGYLGAVLFTNNNHAFRLLARCDDTQLRNVIRWGQEQISPKPNSQARPGSIPCGSHNWGRPDPGRRPIRPRVRAIAERVPNVHDN
jgi:hypothetical protein